MIISDTPVEIRSVAQHELQISWQDGHKSIYSFRYLRQHCRCALCVDEWTRKTLFDPETIALDLKCSQVNRRGNYALSFEFSDQHQTGIYSFEYLRQICSCSACSQSKP